MRDLELCCFVTIGLHQIDTAPTYTALCMRRAVKIVPAPLAIGLVQTRFRLQTLLTAQPCQGLQYSRFGEPNQPIAIKFLGVGRFGRTLVAIDGGARDELIVIVDTSTTPGNTHQTGFHRPWGWLLGPQYEMAITINYTTSAVDVARIYDWGPGFSVDNILITRPVPNILFVFYSVRIVGRIVYSYSAE